MKAVKVDLGLDCPNVPGSPFQTVQYVIRAGDTVRVRLQFFGGPEGSARLGRMEIVGFLLERGALIEVPQQTYRKSALLAAIESGNGAIALCLLDSGADPNSVSPNRSPLIAAAEKGQLSLLQRLLNRGARVDLQVLGQSAIVCASRAGQLEAVALLLAGGADPNTLIGGTEYSAADVASEGGYKEIVELLVRKGARQSKSR